MFAGTTSGDGTVTRSRRRATRRPDVSALEILIIVLVVLVVIAVTFVVVQRRRRAGGVIAMRSDSRHPRKRTPR
jgi:t-SNARE complex subunit (syntaxin)